MTTHIHMISIEKSISLTKWLPSNKALRASNEISICLLLRNSAVTPSQWLAESESDCQSTRAEGGLTCQLQSWQLSRGNWECSQSGRRSGCRRRPPAGERAAFDGPPPEFKTTWALDRATLKLASLVQGNVIVADWSRRLSAWADGGLTCQQSPIACWWARRRQRGQVLSNTGIYHNICGWHSYCIVQNVVPYLPLDSACYIQPLLYNLSMVPK